MFVNKLKKAKHGGDEDDVKAGTLWLSKIEKAEEKIETDDLGMAILKVLGLDEFNPYYPDLKK